MILTTLDVICRRALLESGLPIHYYNEMLFHGATCLRELTFDTLKLINAANLPINAYGAVDLPVDFVDDISLSVQTGSELSRLPKQDFISPIRLHDATSGAFVPYTVDTDAAEDSESYFGYPAALGWYTNTNDYGETTGRNFGASGGTNQGYKVVKERRQIQLTDNFVGSNNVVLLYISDGQSVDNASQIDIQAFQCIRAYQEWKRSPNANNERSPEGQAFYNQKRKLRSRLNDLDTVTIKNILRQHYRATIKN